MIKAGTWAQEDLLGAASGIWAPQQGWGGLAEEQVFLLLPCGTCPRDKAGDNMKPWTRTGNPSSPEQRGRGLFSHPPLSCLFPCEMSKSLTHSFTLSLFSYTHPHRSLGPHLVTTGSLLASLLPAKGKRVKERKLGRDTSVSHTHDKGWTQVIKQPTIPSPTLLFQGSTQAPMGQSSVLFTAVPTTHLDRMLSNSVCWMDGPWAQRLTPTPHPS